MLKPPFVPAVIALRIGATSFLLSIAAFGSPARAQEARPPAEDAEPAAVEAEAEQEDELFDPSDTGYLDSAVIRDQVRLRYDSAFDADRPDRAEFLYGKCLCFTAVAGQDAASPGPAQDLDFQELELAVERAFGERFSLFVEAPFRWIDLTLPTNPVDFPKLLGFAGPEVDNSGIGDLRVGAKYALVARRDRWVTLQLRGYIPTGDAGENLGTGHASIEPAILFFGRLSDRWTFSSEARWWYPLSGSSDPVAWASDPESTVGRKEDPEGSDPEVRNDGFAGDVLRFGVGTSYEGRGARISVSPIVELVGWYVLDGYATPPTSRAERSGGDFGFVEEADGTTIVNLKLGARIDRGRSDSVYLGYGVALTDDVWYDDVFRVEYRYTF